MVFLPLRRGVEVLDGGVDLGVWRDGHAEVPEDTRELVELAYTAECREKPRLSLVRNLGTPRVSRDSEDHAGAWALAMSTKW